MPMRDMTMFDKFTNKIENPIWLRIFMLAKLPSAYFCGVRLKSITDKACYVSIRYKWLSKNPFKSIYFACLAMAAEMSTGVLAMAYCYKKEPKVSMLVTKIEATFSKKATGKIMFKCSDGHRIAEAIEEALRSGKSTSVNAYAYGEDKTGDYVATFIVTWSFKIKTA
jgi:Domain of unknown function (DUF4442)